MQCAKLLIRQVHLYQVTSIPSGPAARSACQSSAPAPYPRPDCESRAVALPSAAAGSGPLPPRPVVRQAQLPRPSDWHPTVPTICNGNFTILLNFENSCQPYTGEAEYCDDHAVLHTSVLLRLQQAESLQIITQGLWSNSATAAE